MNIKEFEELCKKFDQPQLLEERQIKVKLKEILACYDECDSSERYFSDEIIKKFCEIIALYEAVKEIECDAMLYQMEEDGLLQKNNYMTANLQATTLPYQRDEELTDAFFEYFLKEKSAATMKDYVARLNTLAYNDKYRADVEGLFPRERMSQEDIMLFDRARILFIYKNIEILLANFDTKKEPQKQRLNIRSALRKLNDFKRAEKRG